MEFKGKDRSLKISFYKKRKERKKFYKFAIKFEPDCEKGYGNQGMTKDHWFTMAFADPSDIFECRVYNFRSGCKQNL